MVTKLTTAVVALALVGPGFVSSPQSVADRIRGAAAGGHAEAVESIWREMVERGAPIIASSPSEPSMRRATFFWRGEAENVVLITELNDSLPAENQLERLDGTDIWLASFDIPPKATFTYSVSVNDSLVPLHEAANFVERASTWSLDEYNPARLNFGFFETSVAWMGDKAPRALTVDAASARPLAVHELAEPGADRPRRVTVYTPPGYEDYAGDLPLLILFDGHTFSDALHIEAAFDNLIESGEVAPFVGVFIDNRRGRTGDLLANERFLDFVETDLAPWARETYRAGFAPRQTIVGGASFGGLSATMAAWRSPDVFRNVIALSSSYSTSTELDPDPDWMIDRVRDGERKPFRIYMAVGELETAQKPDGAKVQLVSNREMADIMEAKGYDIAYTEYYGGHDYVNWFDQIIEGLKVLIPAS